MIKGLKLVYTGAALTVLACLALQGCGSDATTPAPGGAGSGGSSGSGTAGNGTSGSGTAGNGTAGNGTSGSGGSSGSGTSGTGGAAGAGAEAGASSGPVCKAAFPAADPTCSDYCTTWFSVCDGTDMGMDAGAFATFANNAACMTACAAFTDDQICCRDYHVHLAETNQSNAMLLSLHCGHASGKAPCQ